MQRHHIFSLVMVASAISGILSPVVAIFWVLAPLWLPSWLPVSPEIIFYLCSLMAATTTLLLSGVPAALYERLIGDPDGRRALWIWAASALGLMLLGLAWRLGMAPPPG